MDLTGVWFATGDADDSRNVEDEGSEQEKTNHITTSTITSANAALSPRNARSAGARPLSGADFAVDGLRLVET